MLYETYKLGKIKKNPVRRRLYTREELEAFDLPRLREICRAESIKPPTMETFHQKEEMVNLLYRYLGAVKKEDSLQYQAEGCLRLEDAFYQDGKEQQGAMEVPARMELYQGQTSMDERDLPYIVVNRTDAALGAYAFLTDAGGKIQAILTLHALDSQRYRIYLDASGMSPEIPAGCFHGWSILFLEPAHLEEAVRRYLGNGQKRGVLCYTRSLIYEVLVKEVPVSETPLIIDFGTSYTTAGTYAGWQELEKSKRVVFPEIQECGRGCQEESCGLCPTVMAVQDCSDGVPEHMAFLFGKEAVTEEKKRNFLAGNSVFYDMKRWAGRYLERILVTDLEGNSCEVGRLFLIRQFLLYVIRQAQQQDRVRYEKLCFTCPVRQREMFLRMYREALPEYQILTKDITDEAVAVVYHFLEQGIRTLDYEDGVSKKVLVLDCGGGTSDMVCCDYRIVNEAITSRIDMHVMFAHGDTNFGGNHLTWRVMQLLKIRLAEAERCQPHASLDTLFSGTLSDIYGKVDEEGCEKIYEVFGKTYLDAESVIPTRYYHYRNQPEDIFRKVKGNFYFLWNLAEAIKKRLYSRPDLHRLPLQQLFSDFADDACFDDFHLLVRAEGGAWESRMSCPDIEVEREDINLLWKPDIYGFLKNFIEPWYEDGMLMEVDRIVLSGQSSKIGLFREVMKEYAAGRKARPGGQSGCARKFMCIDGAAAYQRDRKEGRIRTQLSYEPARVPYSLTAEDYGSGGREKVLIQKGTPMGQIYGCLSRPVETEEVLFHLKDGMGKEVFCIPFFLQRQEYQETGYGELLSAYPFLLQEDLDSIQNGELRLFLFADSENWGFSVLEAAREENKLYSRQPDFVPFEAGAWETDFFDGRH